MSKSSGKGLTPDALVASHGADTLRLYEMFLGPLEAAKPWNSQGIEGVHRFLHKVWRECIGREGEVNPRITDNPAADSAEVIRLLHETIKKVGDDIEGLNFNTAISQMMVFSNALQKAPTVSRATMLSFIQVLAPFAPHMSEELWSRLGGTGSVMHAAWPKYDPAKLVSNEVKLVFQVNGKHRGDQLVPVGLPEAEAVKLAHANPRVTPFLDGKALKRVIYVPGRILNIVVE
jgi:leucyl-tRNA synthetase